MAFTAILGAVGSIAGAAGGMMGGKKKGGEAGEGGGGKAGGAQDKEAKKMAKKQAKAQKKAMKAQNKQMKLQTEALQKIANQPPAQAPVPAGDQVNISLAASGGGGQPDPWGTGGAGMPLIAGLTHNFS